MARVRMRIPESRRAFSSSERWRTLERRAMSVSAQDFRSALGQWPSGVSIVTCRSGASLSGMTVSAFASVSLSPPLISVCLEQHAATLAAIARRGCFAVNVLSIRQRALSDKFAQPGNEASRFDAVGLLPPEVAQSPLIEGALVHLDCRLVVTHPTGDHVLCIGAVELALRHEGEPLVFHASAYHRLQPLEQ